MKGGGRSNMGVMYVMYIKKIIILLLNAHFRFFSSSFENQSRIIQS